MPNRSVAYRGRTANNNESNNNINKGGGKIVDEK
jgi:hypothetical protein